MTQPAEPKWYYSLPDNTRDGPKSFKELEQLVRTGVLIRASELQQVGVGAWVRATCIPGLFPPATVLSCINLKGGVGKTTCAVVVAEMLSGVFHKRVLLVDLDHQTNATIMLVGEKRWGELNKRGHTLAQLFKDALEEDRSKRKFDLGKTLQKEVSGLRDVHSLDLLPSSIELIEVQDRLASMSSGRFHTDAPTDILRRAIRPVIDDYDYVVIDCPPNLGCITLNGLRFSQGYVIPTIPDFLSTYGIFQIVDLVAAFADAVAESIEPLGIIISKYDGTSTVHKNMVPHLRKTEKKMPVFNTLLPLSNQVAAAAEFGSASTLPAKFGSKGQWQAYRDLTKEIMDATHRKGR